MRRWLPAPLVSASLLLMWLMLNQTLEPAYWLLGGVLGVLAPLLSRPLQPHGHARIRRPLALFRLLWRRLPTTKTFRWPHGYARRICVRPSRRFTISPAPPTT